MYSVVTKTKCLTFVLPYAEAIHLPSEIQKALKIDTLDKYRWINERVLRVEDQLEVNNVKEKIWLADQVEKKSV
jgi:hypothetical protein